MPFLHAPAPCRAHFAEGHDLVIAGQAHTAKRAAGPGSSGFYGPAHGAGALIEPPRQRLLRGAGGVWRHLRSFRRHLYCAVQQEDLIAHVTTATDLPGRW